MDFLFFFTGGYQYIYVQLIITDVGNADRTHLRPLSVLPLSYNHRLFSPKLAPPFPVAGLGVFGIHILSFPGPKGDGVPMLDLLLASPPLASMDFCHSGLADGENGFSEPPNDGDSDE